MNTTAVLYDYWRSSASYRVRIALHLKGIPFETRPIDLLAGEEGGEAYRAINPQGLVPTLEIDGLRLTQSLAIIDYLDATRAAPRLVPEDPVERHHVLALAHLVAMDIHPVCNPRVVSAAIAGSEDKEAARVAWMQRFIAPGLEAFEALLAAYGRDAAAGFCLGDEPTVADVCLIPQLYNARRWQVGLDGFLRLRAIEETAQAHLAFAAAHPDCYRPND